MQSDEAKESLPVHSRSDDMLNAYFDLSMLNDEQPRAPTECLDSDSELACDGMPILFDSLEPSTLKALNEEPLDFVLDATESGLLEQITTLTSRCYTHDNVECL